MSTKDAALGLLKIAATLFPPLAEWLAGVIAGTPASSPHASLAAEVREILPADASIHAAVRELEKEQGR